MFLGVTFSWEAEESALQNCDLKQLSAKVTKTKRTHKGTLILNFLDIPEFLQDDNMRLKEEGDIYIYIYKEEEPEDRDRELDQLKEKFRERNYPEKVIDEKFEKATKKERRALIFQNRKNKGNGAKKVRLIFTHNEANPPIHKWLRLCKPLLERSAVAKEIGSKIQICTKQPKNLQQILGGYRDKQRMSQKAPLDAGCSKCDKKCKVSCPMMNESNSFRSTRTTKKI